MRVASRYPVTPRSQLLFSYPSRTRLFPSPLFRASLVLTTTPRQARNFGLHLAAAAGDVEPASGARRAREGSGEAQAAAATPTAVAGPDSTCARRARDPTRAATASEIDCHFRSCPHVPRVALSAGFERPPFAVRAHANVNQCAHQARYRRRGDCLGRIPRILYLLSWTIDTSTSTSIASFSPYPVDICMPSHPLPTSALPLAPSVAPRRLLLAFLARLA